MKAVILLCLVTFCLGQNAGFDRHRWAALRGIPWKEVNANVQAPRGADFRYDVTGENEVVIEKQGTRGYNGQSNMAGSYHYPLEDGTIEQVRYYADETGYHAEVFNHPAGTQL